MAKQQTSQNNRNYYNLKHRNMKKLYFFLIAILLVSMQIAKGQTIYWSENFEDSLSYVNNWTISAGTWEIGIPTSGPNAAHGGAKCAATVLAGNYSDWVDSKLISPLFTVPAANQYPRLRFWHYYNMSSNDYGKVMIKYAHSNNWIDISPHYGGYCNGIWSRPYLDLSAYADSAVQLAFYFHAADDGWSGSDVGPGWYFDDLLVETGAPVFNNPETWENGIGSWYSDYSTWEVGVPTSGPNATHGGQNCAATILNGNYTDWVDSKLISPPFTVPSANQYPRLRF